MSLDDFEYIFKDPQGKEVASLQIVDPKGNPHFKDTQPAKEGSVLVVQFDKHVPQGMRQDSLLEYKGLADIFGFKSKVMDSTHLHLETGDVLPDKFMEHAAMDLLKNQRIDLATFNDFNQHLAKYEAEQNKKLQVAFTSVEFQHRHQEPHPHVVAAGDTFQRHGVTVHAAHADQHEQAHGGHGAPALGKVAPKQWDI